ncbi:pyocin knob domain-containing protein [Aeromonas enteropelogenes]|uniref:pyocin knob domain-containing protein n=1 Tax=Aeromonas enteropelogenes TaxID=29489 RepID=UPI000AA14231|nr:pyocin knob domain-containing protein [Aeromonas enteropelogenes]UBH56287.1 pyocin knob domain-containing protein [Aeromonas enteropelogenes]
MPNNYYERLSEMNPGELADGLAIEQEFDAIGRGFSKLPAPHRDGGGFEGPTKVGTPVEPGDAVNLDTLEKLNLPIYRKQITNEDWNTITKDGIYDVVGASGVNKPPVYNFGVLHVYSFNGVCLQIYYPDNNDSGLLAKRTCQNIANNSWLSWGVLSPDTVRHTCLVSAAGTGAPNETVSPAIPAAIVNNSRYVIPNPFGNSVPVICWAEIKINGNWCDASFALADTNAGYGVKATFKQGEGIIIQTGVTGLIALGSQTGTGHTGFSGLITSAPCRVFISRIDY